MKFRCSLFLCLLSLFGIAHPAKALVYSNSILNVDINSSMWMTGSVGPSAPAFGNTFIIPATNAPFLNINSTTPNLVRAYATNTISPYTMFFRGDSLSLGSNWLLKLKGSVSGSINYTTYTFTNSSSPTTAGLILNGGMIEDGQNASSGPITNWIYGVMNAVSGTLSYLSLSGTEFYQVGNAKTFDLAATITGSGSLMICGGTNGSITVCDVVVTNASPASTFSGTWIVEGGYLRPAPNAVAGAFGANCSFLVDDLYPTPVPWGVTSPAPSARLDLSIPIFSTGALTVADNGKLFINANCTFSTITIAGAALTANSNYSAATLASMFPNNIIVGGGGILTASTNQPGTNIDHYDVATSVSSIGAGQVFTTIVTARDASGNAVNDNSTAVTLSSSTGHAQFDANSDGTYGDNTQTLSAGSFLINTMDPLPETVAIIATDSHSKTGTSPPVTLTDYLKLAGIFTNHMVLQREKAVPVWGWATPGLLVTVMFAGQTSTTTSDVNGYWRINLASMLANASPQTLTVTAGNATVIYSDILVGDVWVASGQSNMEYVFIGNPDSETWNMSLVAHDNYPLIRYAMVAETTATNIQTDFTLGVPWVPCISNAMSPMSCVAYYFGRAIFTRTNVPIGIICDAYGGTRCESWTSLQALTNVPELIPTINEDIAEYNASTLALKRTADVLYNSMIAPLIPYAMRGVIWYQGEDNADSESQIHTYRVLFPTMIADWRARWGQGNFPFYFEQLVNLNRTPWPDMRESQFMTYKNTPNTGMSVGIDVGDNGNVHPTNKVDIGMRMAQWALTNDYGFNVVASGPLCNGCSVQNNQITVTFDYAQSGLMAGSKVSTNAVVEIVNGILTGWEIAGSNASFVAATAVISNNTTVVVSAPSIPNPAWVRYAWLDTPTCNLYNRAGLPASPFRVTTTNHPPAIPLIVSNGIASLTIKAPATSTYWVDQSGSLSGSSWLPLAYPRTATGSAVIVSNNLSTQPQQFYRVTEWPY